MLVVRFFHRRKDMASQREYESVVWHFLGDMLKTTDPAEVEDWFFNFVPTTNAQKNRWINAISKVQEQVEKFQGEENSCGGADDCHGLMVSGDFRYRSILQ
jgi:hypothetical protein